jgi:UPF0042 nucleotide-binding protein
MTTPLRIVVITGLSGAGKSTALRVFEDLGYFCVDNLPAPLVGEFARMAETRGDITRVALGIDARGRAFGKGASDLTTELRAGGHDVSVVFLDATDEALVRRFSETRRRHPLAVDADVLTGVRAEREDLSNLRSQAIDVVDTTLLTPHELRRTLVARYGEGASRDMVARLMSFGFRYGIPVDADLVFDVRFLPNPYFVPDLKPLSGRDVPVSQHVLAQAEAQEFLTHCVGILGFLIPLYRREGKSYLTVAFGCTGGRHRSVALVEEVARRLSAREKALVVHRDVERRAGERMVSRGGMT